MIMGRPPSIGERLADQEHPLGSAGELAATHLRSAANRRPPGPVALARVRARLAVSTAAASSNPLRLRWKTILTVVALSAGVGGATGAAMWVAMPILKRTRPTSVSPVPAPSDAHVPRPHRARVRPPQAGESRAAGQPPTEPEVAAAAPPAFEAPGPNLMFGPEPPPISSPPIQVASGSSMPVRSPARKVALVGPSDAPAISRSVAAPPPAPIARQARLLGKALQSLRQDHDPRAALAALDEHAAQFPDSALAPEADITRVDALLALDRRQAALGILDRMAVPATTRGRELVLVRAELRVGARRYTEAVDDFTRALGVGASDDALSERAWHGRIACYLAMGDRTRAQADLREYLNRFPDGRFAPEIRRALDEIHGR